MKIIFDFDGVISRTQEFWLDKLNTKLGTHYMISDWKSYDMKESFPNEFNDLLEIATYSDNSEAKAYDWTLRTIAQLQQYGNHEIAIYSKCFSKERAEQKRKFLKRYNVTVSFIPIVDTDWDKDEVKCDVLIDDNPDVLLRSTAKYRVLVSQPWNADTDLTGTGIIRVKHGLDLYKKIWDLTYVKERVEDDYS